MPKKNSAAVSKSTVRKEKPTPLFLNDPTEILDEIDASLLNLDAIPESVLPQRGELDDDQEETVLFRTCVLTEQAAPTSLQEKITEPLFALAADTPLGKKKNRRRRQIDPTTCERDYTNDEIEFMNALNEYKRSSGRMFPTCSEILEVIRSLGYVRQPIDDEPDEAQSPMAATPLQSGTPALAGSDDGGNQEIVTIFWSADSVQTEETTAPEALGEAEDFEYREPLLIF